MSQLVKNIWIGGKTTKSTRFSFLNSLNVGQYSDFSHVHVIKYFLIFLVAYLIHRKTLSYQNSVKFEGSETNLMSTDAWVKKKK